MYIDGKGVSKDYDKAFELSKKLANTGYPCGINLLGYCYYNGIGTVANTPKGVELYQKTANLGNCLAEYNLAHIYKDGEGIEQDHDKAFELFKKSAEKDYSDGITMLGITQILSDYNKSLIHSDCLKLPLDGTQKNALDKEPAASTGKSSGSINKTKKLFERTEEAQKVYGLIVNAVHFQASSEPIPSGDFAVIDQVIN
ncbi:kinase-like domain-containing protein [Rhizophagus irregularis DAOM 181602=DAOM 197198]|nr:kinase-like domain-containing protein [Rhizophagus irregularis DAOM 181602=DAOM 197198]